MDRVSVYSSTQVLDTSHNSIFLYHHNIIMQMTENTWRKIGITEVLTHRSKQYFFSGSQIWNEILPQEALAYLRRKSNETPSWTLKVISSTLLGGLSVSSFQWMDPRSIHTQQTHRWGLNFFFFNLNNKIQPDSKFGLLTMTISLRQWHLVLALSKAIWKSK